MTTRSILLVVAICAAVAAAAWLGKTHKTSTDRSEGPALAGFSAASKDVTREATVYTLTNGSGSVARIELMENIESADAETLVQDGIMGMQALYANALSPYPGDISNKVITDPAFQPRLFRVTNSTVSYTYMLVFANDRFGYGATTRDSVKYKSLVGWFFCAPRKEFFKVKLFMPPAAADRELEKTFTSLRCR